MKTKLFFRGRLFLFFLLLTAAKFSNSQQIARSVTASNGVFIGFYEFKPLDYDANPATKYPLIIILHGIGERGDGTTQLPNILANAIPKYISHGSPMRFYHNGQWETFLVLSPQLSMNYGSWENFYVDEMLKYAKQNLRLIPIECFSPG
jgi:predicted peptidase